jgi:Cu-processing system permease protein
LKSSNAIWVVARNELSARLRNRWVWTVSGLLVFCVVSIAFFGSAPVGVAGAQESGAALTSLTNLVNYLVPLLALLLGSGALIDEKQRGTLDLLLIYPLTTMELFVGTFLGFFLALTTAVVAGLAISGGALILWMDVPLLEYAGIMLTSLFLGASFLAMAFLLSILAREPARALATSILVWIFFVFLFDLILIGTLIASKGDVSDTLFRVLLMLNPADVFRILSFNWVEGAVPSLGMAAAGVDPPTSSLLWAVMSAWIVVPASVGLWIFRRRVAADALVRS